MKTFNKHTTHKRPSPPQQPFSPFDGLLLVDKPSGPTSHDIVAKIRRRFKIKKVGHGGTLDPMATGLLLILVGKGTKLSQHLMGFDKIYEGDICLGKTTDSQDADGQILSENDASHITREMLTDEMKKMLGDQMQTPPMVSAVKINGVPLYKMARKGKTIEREPKLIHIYNFDLLDFTSPVGTFRVKCSKGTYVRTLCADIGDTLGCGAHLQRLRRTHIGAMSIENAITMDTLENISEKELEQWIIPANKLNLREFDT